MDKVKLIKEVSLKLLAAVIIIIFLLIVLHSFFNSSSSSAVMPVVMLLGALGAFISLQRRLKTLSLDDLQLIRQSVPYILLAPLAGATLAGFLYLAFLSGFISGHMFPKFCVQSHEASNLFAGLLGIRSDDPQDYAKLFFWSFIAGYSEKFVTNIIGRFESNPGS